MKEEKKTFAVLTTINEPHVKIGDWFDVTKNKTIVVGDNKTPQEWNHPKCDFFSISDQKNSEFEIAKELPENHYTRKNIAYLYAIKSGASRIIDTDDDNFPYKNIWNTLLSNNFVIKTLQTSQERVYKNIYTYFSKMDFPFWPRGFPLDKLLDDSSIINDNVVSEAENNESIGLWQCMVDGDPDIDAIHRLIFKNTPKFFRNNSLLYSLNNFCAFNSQNTFWRRKILFPLLYLPSTVSFRFTDILRGYIAQTIMHAKNIKWGFFESSSFQERNEHNIMNDFDSETLMYNQMSKILDIINSSISSSDSIETNLISCYEILHNKGIVQRNELNLVKLWLKDLSSI